MDSVRGNDPHFSLDLGVAEGSVLSTMLMEESGRLSCLYLVGLALGRRSLVLMKEARGRINWLEQMET